MSKFPDYLAKISFLIVDDMTFYHSLIKQMLVTLGHTGDVYTAASVKNAIHTVSEVYQSGKTVDFIVSDYYLNDSNGIHFVKKIRSNERLANTPFVIFTTEDNSKIIPEALEAGIDNFFYKPIDHEIFLERVVFSWNKRHQAK